MQGTGLKQYQRWKNFTGLRCDENGELTNYITSVNNYFSNTSKSTTSVYNWSYYGPNGKAETTLSGTGKGWVNRIMYEVVDNVGHFYAGTHNSGLWHGVKSGNDYVWNILTDGIKQINGIASIIRSNDTYGTIYVATATNISNYSNGIYKSEDNGLNWTPNLVHLLSSGENVYPSSDYKKIPRKLIEHPDNPSILFLLTECYLYKSTDKGQNWTEVLSDDTGDLNYWSGERFSDIIFDTRDPDNIMYIGGFKILKSIDGGNEWTTDITDDVTDNSELKFCIMETIDNVDASHPNYGDVWFLSVDNNDMLRITKFDYSDNLSYTKLYDVNNIQVKATGNKCNLIVDPNNEKRIFYSGWQIHNLNYNSTTGKWINSQISRPDQYHPSYDNILHDDIRDLIFYQSGGKDRLAVACDGGVSIGTFQGINNYVEDWKFDDISVSENSPETDLNINEVFSLSTNNNNGNTIFNCQDVGGYRINSDILERLHGGDGGAILFDENNPSIYYSYDYSPGYFFANYQDDVYFLESMYPLRQGNGYFFAPITKDPNNSNNLFTGGESLINYIDIYSSAEKQNTTLENIEEFDCGSGIDSEHYKYDNYLTDIEISKNSGLILVSTNRSYNSWDKDFECNTPPQPQNYRKALLKSDDGGNTWADLSPNILGLTNGFITNITINPTNDNEIWLCFGKATSSTDPQKTKKVYKSTDGGQSFTAFSEDLPEAIPVWDMEYDSYTDILYIATDIGVFSRPADGSANWVDITENNGSYPLTMVTDIEINYKNRKLYAATFGRGIWETSLEECKEYVNTDVHITGIQEWNEPHSINTNLVIDPGATLTIKDAVYFNSESRFIIREGENGTEGGHLILDGAVLTNGCDDNYWKGIEVWGNGYEDQNPLYQGWITMKNNSVISNAEIGILANNPYYQNAAFNYHGGIVHLSNSTFINNIVSVQLEDYHHQTFNQINNCEFITDENWAHDGAIPDRFISYSNYGYEDVENGRSYIQEVKGCSFENFRYIDKITNSDEWGTGIYAYNTRLLVDNLEIQDGLETYYKPCEFKHLYIGVNALGAETMLPVKVSNSNFSQNKEGIDLYYLFDSEIILNDIEVLSAYAAHGLYMDVCPEGYHIEANNFWGDESSTAENFGIIVNNSGPEINVIYNNSFTGLYCGSAAQGLNYNDKSETREGLLFKCNTYSNNNTDIGVTHDRSSGDPFGIGAIQGTQPTPTDFTTLAGNIFTDENIYSLHEWDLYNEEGANRFTYSYHLYTGGPQPKTDPHAGSNNYVFSDISSYPPTVVSLFLEDHNYPFSANESCPSRIESGGSGGTEIKSAITSFSLAADSITAIVSGLEDGGDTESLNFETITAMPGEELETTELLLSESPNLSDTVMVSAIENESALPNVMLRDVLIENPQAAKSNRVKSALDNKNDAMPDFMRLEIDQSGDTLSQIEVERSKLSKFNFKKQLEFNKLKRYYRNDTNIVNLKDSLIAFYNMKGGLISEYQKAMLQLSTNDTVAADNIISNIPLNFTLSAFETNELQSFEDLLDIKKQMISQGLNSPDSTLLVDFDDLYFNGYGLSKTIAASYLANAGLLNIYRPHYMIDDDSLKSTKFEVEIPFSDKDNINDAYLVIKPNPASAYFIISYKIPNTAKRTRILIKSVNGNTIKEYEVIKEQGEFVVESSNIKSGFYIVSLLNGTSVLDSEKLIISK
ncbi:MAG: hypothetical protein C0595_11750 [Marinilabiliales bacterium]|nr:MAG: hypothetical protein C0595_11750 [Marinilabiliales bacterium]